MLCYTYSLFSSVAQSCPTLWEPMDYSLPGSSMRGDSPAKNTGVGCHFLLQGDPRPRIQLVSYASCWQAGCLPLVPPRKPHFIVKVTLQPARLLCPWNSPGQNTVVDSCSLLQGIFPTQGLKPGLPHCRQILYHLSYQGSPFIPLSEFKCYSKSGPYQICFLSIHTPEQNKKQNCDISQSGV